MNQRQNRESNRATRRLTLCKAYGQQAYHDSRNCPTKIS